MFTIKLPEYIPDVSYFWDITFSRLFLFADHIFFRKRSAITRSSLFGTFLSIPVVHTGKNEYLYNKRIAYIENWPLKHLKFIYHHYHKHGYFDFFFPSLEQIIIQPKKYLTELLSDLHHYYFKCLQINADIVQTSALDFQNNINEDLASFASKNELNSLISTNVPNSFLNLEYLTEKNINVQRLALPKTDFLDGNILDFLFEYGPEASFKFHSLKQDFKLP